MLPDHKGSIPVTIKHNRYPNFCAGCASAKNGPVNEAAQVFAGTDLTITGVFVDSCSVAPDSSTAEVNLTGVKQPSENDYTGRVPGTVTVPNCPGRVHEIQLEFDRSLNPSFSPTPLPPEPPVPPTT